MTDLDFNVEYEKCRKNPHKYIMDWMEQNLKHIGAKTFKILALQPCSLILPDLPFQTTDVRSSFNILFLSPPGCLSGETTIRTNRNKLGRKFSIKYMYNQFHGNPDKIIKSKRLMWNLDKPTFVRSFNGTEIRLHKIKDVVYSGKREIYELLLENGKSLKATFDHKIMTNNGFIELGKLDILRDKIMCDTPRPILTGKQPKIGDTEVTGIKFHPRAKIRTRARIPIHQAIYEANLNNLQLDEFINIVSRDEEKSKTLRFVPVGYVIHHKDGNHFNNAIENLDCLTNEDHQKIHAKDSYSHFSQGIPNFVGIKSISKIGIEDTYDICCEDPHHNFVANDIVVKNSGKSSITSKYESILTPEDAEDGSTYTPFKIRGITNAKLIQELSDKDMFTLILEDLSYIGDDYEMVKTIEGAVGDEKSISKSNMREDTKIRTQGCSLLCGTWTDLGRYLDSFKSGLLFRYVLIFSDLTPAQEEEIGRHINNSIGERSSIVATQIKEKVVRRYYDELFSIMEGRHKEFLEKYFELSNYKPIPQIKGYQLDSEGKEAIFNLWSKARKQVTGKLEFQFNRELHEGYRMAVASAMLNVFNRKVDEQGLLHPNKEDFDLAKEIMKENLQNKISILQSQKYLSENSFASLRASIQNGTLNSLDTRTRRVLLNLAGQKTAKV